MALIKVDLDKCICCGACAAVCPSRIISVEKEAGPKQTGRLCIACGHCVAVCPTAALDNRRSPLAQHVELDGWALPAAEEMVKILRSRRSIRAYQEKEVPLEKITELLDVARHAQTATNSQGLSFLVVQDKAKLRQITEAVISWMEEQVQAQMPGAEYFAGAIASWREQNYDIILRGAPCLLVAIAGEELRMPQSNCEFVWSYAELFAPFLGLGTCIAGYAQYCAFSGHQALLDILELPANTQVAGALMLGYPKYKYRRLPPRQPLNVYIR